MPWRRSFSRRTASGTTAADVTGGCWGAPLAAVNDIPTADTETSRATIAVTSLLLRIFIIRVSRLVCANWLFV
jgi:hypothetical protein